MVAKNGHRLINTKTLAHYLKFKSLSNNWLQQLGDANNIKQRYFISAILSRQFHSDLYNMIKYDFDQVIPTYDAVVQKMMWLVQSFVLAVRLFVQARWASHP